MHLLGEEHGWRRLGVGNLAKRQRHVMRNRHFRLCRVGPGHVLGATVLTSGVRSMGVWVAETDCELHCLPFHHVKLLERDQPVLALRLFQILARQVSERLDSSNEHIAAMTDMIYTQPPSPEAGLRLRKAKLAMAASTA